MANSYSKEFFDDLEKMEREYEGDKAKVDRGRPIYEEFQNQGINKNDYYAMDDFTSALQPYDMECFYAALEYFDRIKNLEKDNTHPAQIPASEPTKRTVGEGSKKLSEVFDKWVEFNTEIKAVGKRWSKASIKKFVPQVELFVALLDDPFAAELSREMIRDKYKERIVQLPDRLKQREIFIKEHEIDRNGKKHPVLKPIDEIYAIADNNNLKRISSRTVEDYVRNTTTFIKWASKNDYIAHGLESVLEDLTDIAGDDDRKKAFTEEELKKLFESEEYQKGLLFKNPERHWIPLISLYTGCRLGEASQLYTSNILKSEEGKCWIFVFTNEDENQSIKTKKSIRKVPIHPDLVKLGLIKYWDQRKEDSRKKLFLKLSPDAIGHWGRHVSRWFNGETINGQKKNGYMEKCGIVTKSDKQVRNFQSFRHYVVNRSKQERRWDYGVWCEITGHSAGKETVRQKSYEEEFPISLKYKEMRKLKMDFLEIEKIREWK